MSLSSPRAAGAFGLGWRQLDSMTRNLLVFALVNTVALNLLALAVRGPVAAVLAARHPGGWIDSSTTLHHTAAFLLGRAGQDSWEPMRQALEYVRTPHDQPLYSALFFDRGIDFIYPPTSLVFLDLLGRFAPGRMPSNFLLNLLAWLAVAGTAAVTGRLFLLGIRRYLGERFEHRTMECRLLALLAGLMTLAFYPVVKAFSLGQIQAWSTFLFSVAILAWMTGRKGTAGALCGLVCVIKPQLGVFVVWGLLRREMRFVGGWATTVVPIGLLSVFLYGWASHWNYVQLASFITQHSWSYYPNQSVNGLLNRLFFNGGNLVWDPHYAPYNPWVYAGTMATSVLLVGGALFWGGGERGRGGLEDFMIAGLSFTMASPVAWEHHYGILMPMFACALPATLAIQSAPAAAARWLAVSFVLASNVVQAAGLVADSRFNVLQSYLFVGALLMLVQMYTLRRAQS